MICPYTVTRNVVTQTRAEYNEEGAQTFVETVEQNTAIPIECRMEECGAWKGLRGCCYNSGE